MNTLHYLIHTTAYYIAWFACITLAAKGYSWISPLIVVVCVLLQLYWQYRTKRPLEGLWLLSALLVSTGILVDSILVYNGVIIYTANPLSPYFTSPWMMSLWISFTVVLYATLSSLFTHLVLLGLLSWVGFALAFRIGESLGAAYFPYGSTTTCFFIGLIWSILLPLCVHCYQRIRDNK